MYLYNSRKEQIKEYDSRAEAEEQREKLIELGMDPADVELTPEDPRTDPTIDTGDGVDDADEQENPPHDHHGEPVGTDGGETAVVEPEGQDDPEGAESESDWTPGDEGTPAAKAAQPTPTEESIEPAAEDALNELKTASVDTDPLDILPSYMITRVEGKPTLNKRGVSVLAYHYDIDVSDREIVAYPHEHDYKTAVVEIEVKNGDGRTFVGVGEAHVDETPKHQLLRMAETRAYKRAVIFATGTGIVGYQEVMEELE